MEKKILKLVSKKFKIKKINLKDSPKNITTWDSLAHLELIQDLNHLLKIQISFEDTIKIRNVSDIIKICNRYIK